MSHGKQRSECECGHWREWSGVRGITAERAQRLHDQVRPECGRTVKFEADRIRRALGGDR